MKYCSPNNIPEVSILLPNYNKRKYIYERLQSINDQLYKNWELIIVDGYSDDGSWEVIQEFTKSINNPVQVLQLPQKGIYDAINECIKRSSGKYIYIATSDDLMTEDCLEKMVKALDENPECNICHSCLKMIDENGFELKREWLNSYSSKYFGGLLKKKHIRYAPHDAILQCFLYTVYTSLTQLLITKEVFNSIGMFNNNYGSAGDFEWELRASLRFNTIHIPYFLSSWRIYPEQATNSKLFTTVGGQDNFIKMIRLVLLDERNNLEKNNINIDLKKLTFCNRFEKVISGYRQKSNYRGKISFILDALLTDVDIIIYLIYLKLVNKNLDRITLARKYISSININNKIKLLDS